MYAGIAAVLVVGFLGWVYQSTKPAPPRICGTPDGPPVTSPRIKLSDGRHLAYRESGVPKDEAKYRIIVIHGFDNSKEFSLPASQDLIEELRIYFLSFDRAGYGDSDPNPKRSVKSEAFDIQELADQLDIGSKFYVIGASMGGYSVWGCLKYIPHRLAGVSLVSPVVNYWWPSLPANLSRNALREKSKPDQWLFRIAHYAPGLQYWLTIQKWLPSFPLFEGHPVIFSSKDKDILTKTPDSIRPGQDKVRQQGVFESLHRDVMIGFGTWDFDPMDLSNPFPQGEGSVYIWQGQEDRIVPCLLQRYVAHKLPWIRYHEVHDGGHLFIYDRSLCGAILRELFLGEEPSSILLD